MYPIRKTRSALRIALRYPWVLIGIAAIFSLVGLLTVGVNAGSASVTAHPEDPGAPARVTVVFTTTGVLEPYDSITLEMSDTLGVPKTIQADDVVIFGTATITRTGPDGTGPLARVSASPKSVTVGANRTEDRHRITLEVPDMIACDTTGNRDGLSPGQVTSPSGRDLA